MSDLTQDWHSSIGVKLTAAILWTFVIVSTIASVTLQTNIKQEIYQELSTISDLSAYQVNVALIATAPNYDPDTVKVTMQQMIDDGDYYSLRLTLGDKAIEVKENDDNRPSESHRRILHLPDYATGTVVLEVRQPLVDDLVAARRIHTLLLMGAGFLAFGAFLIFLTKLIVIKPIFELVDATKHVAEGDLTQRLNSERVDEFGYLSHFFDLMLDRISTQQEELEHAVSEAQQANSAKSSFLANMSHELRTPLNAIIGYSEMLKEDAEDTGDQQVISDLKKITIAGKHLLSLINDILDLSKIEANQMELLIEECDLTSLVYDVSVVIKPLSENNNNDFKIDCPPDIGTMTVDVTRLRQLLFNLLGNACKFTKNGEISLSIERVINNTEDRILFKIKDSGIGMDKKYLARLFDPFSQADNTTTKLFGGTGLGLTISRRFSELMGGEIAVESEREKGSLFTVNLPAEYSDISEMEELITPPAEKKDPSNARLKDVGEITGHQDHRAKISTVLVVDDDKVAIDIIDRMLRNEGFNVITATDSATAIESARTLCPDVITLDIMMPGKDGWETLAILKTDKRTQDIPVIVLSMIDNRQIGESFDIKGYLFKPIDKDALASTVKRCARQ